MEPLVDAAWLAEHAADPDLRIIDFRWYLDARSGRAAYDAGHIPGAVFVDLEAVTAPSGPGRHPLPATTRFEAEMRLAGVSAQSLVVVYDDAGGSIAASQGLAREISRPGREGWTPGDRALRFRRQRLPPRAGDDSRRAPAASPV